MNIGRFIPEILRIVKALQVSDCSKASTPANWIPCQSVIQKVPKTFNELIKREEEINENKNGISWYLSFKNPNCCNNIEK